MLDINRVKFLKGITFAFLHLVVFALICVACGQDYNSNSSDDHLGANASSACTTNAQKRLCEAQQIIGDHCKSCHSGWTIYTSDDAWIRSGLVSAGSAQASKLITNLKNAGGSMPVGSDTLSQEEYQALVDWVTQIKVQ